MNGRARLAAGLALALVALVAAGCEPKPKPPPRPDKPEDPSLQRAAVQDPGWEAVREAVDDLGRKINRLYKRWPEEIVRSRDFPDRPLVRLQSMEDRGTSEADLPALSRALEETLRFQGYLRLLADERAVPSSLREEGDVGVPEGEGQPAEIEASLRLVPWVDRIGRIQLDLYQEGVREPLVSGQSRSRNKTGKVMR